MDLRATPADARLARQLLRERRQRDSFLGKEHFGEPAWDIILDLFASQVEGRPVSVTSTCIGAEVAVTTGIRHLAHLEEAGLVVRERAEADGRMCYVRLSQATMQKVSTYLRQLPPREGLGVEPQERTREAHPPAAGRTAPPARRADHCQASPAATAARELQ